MDLSTAIHNLEALANGIDPCTGELFEAESVYNQPEVIRALFTVLTLVKRSGKIKKSKEQKQQENLAKGLPKNAGLPWSEQERSALIDEFNSGGLLHQLAELHERSQGSIVAELKKQGLIDDK